MGDIEDLLARIKAEKENVPSPDHPPGQQKSDVSPSPLPQNHSVEDLLGQLGEPTPQRSLSLNAILRDASPETQPLPPPIQSPSTQGRSLDLTAISPRSSAPINPPVPDFEPSTLPVLADLKAKFLEEQRQREAQERAEQERLTREREAALEKERQRQEQEAKAKQARLTQAAEEWLRQLEPLSGEAIWFDEFAAHYNSRLEAAIAYLDLEP